MDPHPLKRVDRGVLRTKGSRVIQYRGFRNDDSPGLVEVWNSAFGGRGAVPLRGSGPLERFVFSKPYFDPAGLIVAVEDDKRVGFAHAGFGPSPDESRLNPQIGVVCALGVRDSHRHQGIATELLRRSEGYLRGRGAQTLQAGPQRPWNPFYFGLYGGSDSPGFLASDPAAGPFLTSRGYQASEPKLIFDRNLTKPLSVVDARFVGLRRAYELRVLPRGGIASWWQECVLGGIEILEFRLEEASSHMLVARAGLWEMEGFSWRWGVPAVGFLDFTVCEDMRQKGLGKFLLTSILRYLQDQYFGVAEMHVAEGNTAAIRTLLSTGFEQVDTAHIYRKSS